MIKEWDIVVVGGGAAGWVLASRLSATAERSVLLLEAGPDSTSPTPDDVRDERPSDFDHDWGYCFEPDSDGSVGALYRGKLLGGCSIRVTPAIRVDSLGHLRCCGNPLRCDRMFWLDAS